MLGDSRLTLIPHLKGLRSTCIKRLNILRAEIVSSWGAGRTSMLRFYNNCLDYGCQVYSSAKPTAMRILDLAHKSAIRLTTGPFRSSPVASLLAESVEPPLSLRWANTWTDINGNKLRVVKNSARNRMSRREEIVLW